ncbi:LysR family transcriptional regulator [Candidatus Epulonipiscium viviparus]|uniref:LysR family transcriptional regulator n=1 Tax=Candidatus Epulonipiscium viviparus TaxID=420336 RepID=UPI000494F683|nr:LysR family transcriptional regulator [Candidatus Epulopiscium viviparus]
MDFKELNYVLAVAKFQNITKASQYLFISQPSLSKYIKNLEESLGTKLFNRLGNRFTLTYAGEYYIESAKEIISIKNRLDQQLVDIALFDKGKLNIGIPPTRGSYLFPLILPIFNQKYPNVEINTSDNTTKQLENALISGELDIAVLTTPITNPFIEYEFIKPDYITLVISADHVHADKGVLSSKFKYPWIDINYFNEDPFILASNTQRIGQIAFKTLNSLNFNPITIYHIENFITTLNLVDVNSGVCFMSEFHLKHLSKGNLVQFSVGTKDLSYDVVVAYRKGSYLSAHTREIINIIKEVL